MSAEQTALLVLESSSCFKSSIDGLWHATLRYYNAPSRNFSAPTEAEVRAWQVEQYKQEAPRPPVKNVGGSVMWQGQDHEVTRRGC